MKIRRRRRRTWDSQGNAEHMTNLSPVIHPRNSDWNQLHENRNTSLATLVIHDPSIPQCMQRFIRQISIDLHTIRFFYISRVFMTRTCTGCTNSQHYTNPCNWMLDSLVCFLCCLCDLCGGHGPPIGLWTLCRNNSNHPGIGVMPE